MTTKELRELDAWIAENVMGWREVCGHNGFISETEYFIHSKTRHVLSGNESFPFVPTELPAAAMEVLKKCAEIARIEIFKIPAEANKNGKAMWWINEPLLAAETLELAICLFAKKLFSK